MTSVLPPARRGFLAGAATLLAAPAMATGSTRMEISGAAPKLWADGIHDDTSALNWILGPCPGGERVRVPPAVYRITDTIRIQRSATLVGCEFRAEFVEPQPVFEIASECFPVELGIVSYTVRPELEVGYPVSCSFTDEAPMRSRFRADITRARSAVPT